MNVFVNRESMVTELCPSARLWPKLSGVAHGREEPGR